MRLSENIAPLVPILLAPACARSVPDVQEDVQHAIDEIDAIAPIPDIRGIPCDLAKEMLTVSLERAGFEPSSGVLTDGPYSIGVEVDDCGRMDGSTLCMVPG